MEKFWKKVEQINSKIIPYALVVLLVIIIYELFFHLENERIDLAVKVVDGIVIAIFVVDLIFLAIHSKNTRFFFKNYWLDILAVLPLGIVFRVVEEVYQGVAAAERIVISQAIGHEVLEAEKELKAVGKAERVAKFFRIGTRSLRLVTKSRLFTKFKTKRRRK